LTVTSAGLFERGLAEFRAGNLIEAERLFKGILASEPRHAGALNLLGIALTQRGAFADAETYLRRALQESPKSDATHYNYGIVLKALNRPAEALQRFSQALAINPAIPETWNNRGTVFNDLERYDEALADFDKAIALEPRYADAFYNKGKSLAVLHRPREALAAFETALTIDPKLAEAWLGRGHVLFEQTQYDGTPADHEKALASFDRAKALKPEFAEAWFRHGDVLMELRRYDEAFVACDKAYILNSDLPDLAGRRLEAKLHMCAWADQDRDTGHLLNRLCEGKRAASPFVLLALPSSPADQLQCAKIYVQDQPASPQIGHNGIYPHDRLRLGYLSSDFRQHATAFLTAGLFEKHDRSRFEVVAFSLAPEQDSEIGRRVKASFDRFVDCHSLSDQQIADLIRQHEIDIAVDLKGFTSNSRPGILAHRPAPIQVNWLVYPGTLGANYIDYIIADQTVIPKEHFKFYSEKVVWLPDSYQVNDSMRPISNAPPARGELGLPEAGFVFCCFNNSYKITPQFFDIWMRLLLHIDNSVLWLLDDNPWASQNLRLEAERRSVAAQRLVFAPRIAPVDHLARHRRANLFLDTLPYNAHTTASDSLWMGLPVVTCLGSTFAGRVAASLLKAVGLDELITTSLEDYEALALKLAHEPSQLGAIAQKLASNRATCPLFDTERFTWHIEAAYLAMWEAHRAGRMPAHFSVRP
jgi:protein O-GlcNAc transferase